MQYTSREVICREGEFINALYIVKKGFLEGSSLQTGAKHVYGPGSIVGEFCLVENSAITETITAQSDCEIQIIEGQALKDSLQQEPSWIGSIVHFLSQRSRIAEGDFRKSLRVRSLPSLLYLLSTTSKGSQDTEISLSTLIEKMSHLSNLPVDITKELLQILQEMDLLKIQSSSVRVKNKNVVEMLYKAILHRALRKEPSPNILSITEQMVLKAVIKAAQESSEPLQNGTCTITSENLANIARKVTFGMTLTMRNIQPLLDKNILQCAASDPVDVSTPIESIQSFSGDLDHIIDLMELNRIFPLLDKKLVE
ncbi:MULTISPECIES: Crp/Fnr family transcriptional regulator [unclassified Fibrobacter]|uniref:Crp/Fnr family transcriptional regulator n=1 Tax=unclassified Fibrobacter TaxID=2634177 RepID=UPI000D6D3D27|nr:MULTISPECIES: cyclic nucleotide-binding domain-containing protein [unclassified Fibrobacter]PWJ69097.1 CRP-like cAMP-binding protein [Fibrobacter sp. UWR4]PZW72928.1 CRP-like cAMP-binding protein [Fibrobacter sp. UWR1]